jgi:GNAT superfamily N-acetyltransferase
MNLTFQEVLPNDQELIDLISKWYLAEWAIPTKTICHRLTSPSSDDLIFHLNAFENGVPVASGGLYWNVGLFKVYPEYKRFGPWVGLVYTIPEKRGQGIGKLLLKEIERRSLTLGYQKIYLFTNTAEALYLREGWSVIARMIYKEKDTVVMEKSKPNFRS